MTECECGCKEILKKGNRFIYGHNFKGKQHSKKSKELIRFLSKGRYPSEKTKKKMSDIRLGEKNHFYGKHHTEKTKKQLSKSHKGKKVGSFTEEHKRKIGEAVTGERNGAWRGGIFENPYDLSFTEKLKQRIKERDGRCMLCKTLLSILSELKKLVHIHHIDYDKTNSFPQNLITLCHNCHGLTNTDRKHWIKFFQSLLSEEHNYRYTEDQRIILDFTGDETV